MDIHIPSQERLRVSTNQSRVFVDASSSTHQECLTIEFYNFQKQIIKLKDNTYKMFIFQKDQDISDFDFGYWSDGETIWKSF